MRTQKWWDRGSMALACMVAAVGAGCSPGAHPTQPTTLSQELTGTASVQGQGTASAAAAAEPSLGPELAAVRRATAAFHDAADAAAAGYVFGEPCVESPAGAMGVHTPNPALIGTQALDPERPEVLLYLEKPGGGMRLIGVEYLQVVLLRDTASGQVGPWFSSSPWPSTYEVVTPVPQLFGQTFDGPMPGHNPSMPWHWDLHAWVWAHNPSGVFCAVEPLAEVQMT